MDTSPRRDTAPEEKKPVVFASTISVAKPAAVPASETPLEPFEAKARHSIGKGTLAKISKFDFFFLSFFFHVYI